MTRVLTHEEARTFYDGFGATQDKQGWYEDAALALVKKHGAFAAANNVLEFGCGTGKLAQELLADYLPDSATYLGLDISEAMISIATSRLTEHADRAGARVSPGAIALPVADSSVDRVVACYVIDLLSPEDTATFISEARRALQPGGLLCLASLTTGKGLLPRLVSGAWAGVHKLNPKLVGGCRPVEMQPLLSGSQWNINFTQVVRPYSISSEVVIAEAI